MTRSRSVHVLTCVLLSALGASVAVPGVCSAQPSSNLPGRITWYPHTYRTADGQMFRTELGRLTVPENRAVAGSKLIEVAFVRFRSTAPTPGPPIILVAGGPGTSGIEMPRGTWSLSMATLLAAGDVIALDQRGVGLSRPTLDCAETLDLPIDVVRTRSTYAEVVREKSRACRAYWQSQGVDLAAYHTEASADDIDAVRAALGADTMTLVGGSYGSHLMLATIRRHGDRVARAVIMGTEGTDHTIKLPSNGQKQLEKIAKAVASNAVVGPLVPDLVALLGSVLNSLAKQPMTVEATDPRNGQKVKVTLGRFDLQLVTAQGLGSSAFIRQLPAVTYDMAHGDFTWLAQEVLRLRGQSIGSAMAFQVDCASGISEERAARIRREAPDTLLGDVLDFPVPDVCDAWVAHDLGPAFRAPVRSAVPVLFFSGTLDGRTPPTNAEEIKAGFPNSFHVIVDNATHSGKEMVFTLPVTKDAAATFLHGGAVTIRAAALPPLEFAKPRTVAAAGQSDLERPDVVDARYGPAARNVLDLWKAPSARPTPVIVYFHGGGFINGGKEAARGIDMLKWALQAGVSFASVSYQYTKDGVHLPTPMLDGARAVQFLRANARAWNLDPKRVAAYGVSAGAGISLWMGFHDDLADPRSADPVTRQSSRLTAVGQINGQVSYDPHVVRALLGPAPESLAMLADIHGVTNIDTPAAHAAFDRSSPLRYLTRDDPPVFTYYRYELGPVPPDGPGYMHNPRFGVTLKERMGGLGIECVFRHLGDYSTEGREAGKAQAQQRGDREMLDFFLRHFGLTRGPA